MQTLIKLIFSLTLSSAVAFLASEIYIRLYILKSGTTRAAHSDDYGMAFYSLVIAAIAFCLVAIACMAYFAKQHNQKDRKQS